MNDEYTKEEMEKTGNYVYGGKRHDAICDELEKSGYTELEINLVSIGVWKGIESERNKSQEEIKRLKEENKKLRKLMARLKINLNTCKNDYWFMTNLLEHFSSNKEQGIKDCIERMKFRKKLFDILAEE